MRTRSLLLALFLYVILAWVWAAYRFSGDQIVDRGLFWTAMGIAGLLAFVVLEKTYGWWKVWRADRAARPKPPKAEATPLHEDDEAMAKLWSEATVRLAGSPQLGAAGHNLTIAHLPMVLLVGRSGAGKTSTFVNSGIEPHLLAGQVRADGPVQATKLANIWIARQQLYVEISGRLWDGDLNRWRAFLQTFRGDPPQSFWRRLWKDPPAKPMLSAVVLFDEISSVSGAVDAGRLGLASKHARERLQAIADTFQVACPVLAVLTKTDGVKYYEEFFARLPEAETLQAVGHWMPPTAPGMSAENMSKGLSRAFANVSYRLSDRRIPHLARETDASKKPAIYEFPREFRRMRAALVQFLGEIFRPDPLRAGPQISGFYFTGTRLVEALAQPPSTTTTTSAVIPGMVETQVPHPGPTQIFRLEATQIFRPEDAGAAARQASSSRQTWMFARELFQEIAPRLFPAAHAGPRAPSAAVQRQRNMLGAVAAGAAIVLGLIWLNSWWQNRQDLNRLEAALRRASATAAPTGDELPLDSLQRLDGLRAELERLQGSAPLPMRWGLYSLKGPIETARSVYFRQFHSLLLGGLHRSLVEQLEKLPAAPPPSSPFEPAYGQLSTLLAISGSECNVNPQVVASVLAQEADSLGLVPDDQRKHLAQAQIRFYVAAFDPGPPVELGEAQAAVEHGRAYLDQITTITQVYCRIIGEVNQALRPVRFSDSVTQYAPALRVVPNDTTQICVDSSPKPGEVAGAFTDRGYEQVLAAAKKEKIASQGDPCILGAQGDSGTEAIMRLYVQDYKLRWKRLLTQFAVAPYANAADAARKLEVLSGYRSPLLGLFAFTSDHTYFAKQSTAKPGEQLEKVLGKTPVVKEIFKKRTDPTIQKLRAKQAKEAPDSPGQIRDAFDVVHRLVPPESEQWITPNTDKYAKALATLQKGMLAISRSSGLADDPASIQAALAAHDAAAEEVRAMTAGSLKPVGSEGIDTAVMTLLMQPISNAKYLIPDNVEKAVAGKVGKDLAQLCSSMQRVLGKFPFNERATTEATLEEVASLFAPEKGAVWLYVKGSLPDLVVKRGREWIQNPEKPKPQLSTDLLTFLNRGQQISDAFFAAGAAQPHLSYALRVPDGVTVGQRSLEFEFDGRKVSYSDAEKRQKSFDWPAPAGARAGASARVVSPGASFGFGGRSGLWGVFHVFGGAEPRALGASIVEWKTTRGAGGEPQAIEPPVRMEFVEFPGGMDLFNPAFFKGLACPAPGRAAR